MIFLFEEQSNFGLNSGAQEIMLAEGKVKIIKGKWSTCLIFEEKEVLVFEIIFTRILGYFKPNYDLMSYFQRF